jgi:hypothetical protein
MKYDKKQLKRNGKKEDIKQTEANDYYSFA